MSKCNQTAYHFKKNNYIKGEKNITKHLNFLKKQTIYDICGHYF